MSKPNTNRAAVPIKKDIQMGTEIPLAQSKLWDSYRNMYAQIDLTGGNPDLHKLLLEVGTAMIDEDYQLAADLAAELKDRTIQPGTVPLLGWIPTLCAKELLDELELLRDAA